ncbi:tetratricopeptide repeat protein [candidate division KSB1 bacterium]|nr:tetratricopeptide repeat protein [candidate division KSB1 bacterium]
MKLKFIFVYLSILLVFLNCQQSGNHKRKIRLAIDKSDTGLHPGAKDTTFLKLNAGIRRSIAVLTFRNQSGRENLEWLSRGIADMLIRDLSQSRILNVITLQRILDIFKSLEIDPHGELDDRTISQIGQFAHAEAVIYGSFYLVQNMLSINVQLYDCNSGMLLKEENIEGEGLEHVFSMVDALTLRVKTGLKLSFEEMNEPDFDIAQISTKSLQAYKCYTEGVHLAYKAYIPDAIQKMNQAIGYDSTFAMAHFWASIAYKYLGQIGESNRSLLNAVEYAEHVSPKEKLKIDWVYAAFNNEHEKAFDYLKKLVQLYPDDKELNYQLAAFYYYQKQTKSADHYLDFTLKLDPDYAPAYMLASVLAREKGDYESAIKWLEKHVQLKPEDATPYHNLGEMYETLGSFERAISYYQQALSIKPDFYYSILNLAHTYSTVGEYERGRERYRSALTLLPNEELKAEVFAGLAQIDISQGKFSSALRNIRRALAFPKDDSERATYLVLIANVYFRKGQFDSTIAFARRAVSLNEQSITAHNTLCNGFLKLGEIDSAEAAARAVDRFIENTKFERMRNIHSRLMGKLAAAKGNYKEAINIYRKILADNIEATSIYYDLGRAYLDNRQPMQAIESFNKYLANQPNDALCYYYLALAHEANGERDDARKKLRRCLTIWQEADPDVPELVQAKARLADWEDAS